MIKTNPKLINDLGDLNYSFEFRRVLFDALLEPRSEQRAQKAIDVLALPLVYNTMVKLASEAPSDSPFLKCAVSCIEQIIMTKMCERIKQIYGERPMAPFSLQPLQMVNEAQSKE